MKTIRWSIIMGGLFLALAALAVTGVKAQGLSSPSFVGTFTVPVETHWGRIVLPAGDYTLTYGRLFQGGTYIVRVAGEAKQSPRGMILPMSQDDVKAGDNVLNCLRVGDTLYVRALEMPAIGESVHFKIPHGVEVESKVIAGHQNHEGNNQIAQVAIGIERMPVK